MRIFPDTSFSKRFSVNCSNLAFSEKICFQSQPEPETARNKKAKRAAVRRRGCIRKRDWILERIGFPFPYLGDFYYIIENFSVVCEIFGSMALRLCVFCVQD